MGSLLLKVVPSPGLLFTLISSICSVTIRLTRGRPIPNLLSLELNRGLKIFSLSSGLIPAPLSVISRIELLLISWVEMVILPADVVASAAFLLCETGRSEIDFLDIHVQRILCALKNNLNSFIRNHFLQYGHHTLYNDIEIFILKHGFFALQQALKVRYNSIQFFRLTDNSLYFRYERLRYLLFFQQPPAC